MIKAFQDADTAGSAFEYQLNIWRARQEELRQQLDAHPGQTASVPSNRAAVEETLIDGKPATISDDYFDVQLVRGTEVAGPADTTRENILAEAGYEQVYDIDEIITRMPTPEEVKRLDQLTKRVARIEQILADGSRTEADPP